MKILFLGDIYGKQGRDMIAKHVPSLRKKYHVDFVIGNGENATHGKGLSLPHYNFLLENGIDAITMGNHFFTRNEKPNYYLQTPKLIRPANIHPSAAGVGSREFIVNDTKIRVTNLLGRVFINELSPTNPFEALDKILEKDDSTIHIVDFHAEATAEKIALGWCYDGKVSAVLGTHTHVQTADERILNNGTAFISDVGMTGPYNSVIGANIEQIIIKTKTGVPMRFDIATGPGQLCGVIMDFNDKGKCTSIERIFLKPNQDW